MFSVRNEIFEWRWQLLVMIYALLERKLDGGDVYTTTTLEQRKYGHGDVFICHLERERKCYRKYVYS